MSIENQPEREVPFEFLSENQDHGADQASYPQQSAEFVALSSRQTRRPKTPTLSNRETVVLAALARFRFLTMKHIEGLLFQGGSPITLASRQVLTRRVLTTLLTAGLVTRTERPVGGPGGGSGAFAYFLTTAGSRAVSAGSPVRDLHRMAPRGTFLMRHALASADVALAFFNAANRQDGHEVLVWECDREIAQRAGHETVIPDAFLIYATPTTEFHAFVEIDLGTAGSRYFQSKIQRYVRLFRSGRWQQTLEVWPVILTVAPTAARSALLRRSTETVLSAEFHQQEFSGAIEFAFAVQADVIHEGPLAPIWQIAHQAGSHELLPSNEEGIAHAK